MSVIPPPALLGMLGGGQLGRFFVQAAQEMGYGVWVLDPDPESPAGRLAQRHLVCDYTDPAALAAMAQACAAISTEFENVPASTLDWLAQHRPVRPAALAVSVCQNRVSEKNTLARHGLPHAPFAVIASENDIEGVDAALFPAILKVARFGYDGKGQARVATPHEALAAFAGFGKETCVLEKQLALDTELSVVLCRSQEGQIQPFLPCENRHRNGILDVTFSPATAFGHLNETLAQQALAHAVELAHRLDYVGTLAVEFFVSQGRLYINEMAPRPHNSGHHTLEACDVSQYQQQVRALCGLPLAAPRQHSLAIMVNLLGELWFPEGVQGPQREPEWSPLYALPGFTLHLYGKSQPRPGRKMGHFTLTGEAPAPLLAHLTTARAHLGLAPLTLP
jgi:5-(carboxyamino)imidazole ribonucleotide synthase